MKPEQLDAIEARAKADMDPATSDYYPEDLSAECVALVAEVRRLRAELREAERGLRHVVVRLLDGPYTTKDAERHGLEECQARTFRVTHVWPADD